MHMRGSIIWSHTPLYLAEVGLRSYSGTASRNGGAAYQTRVRQYYTQAGTRDSRLTVSLTSLTRRSDGLIRLARGHQASWAPIGT